jgi:hypothetical protein
MVLFDSVYAIALTAWVGSILFVSFGVAPLIFTVLGAESGAKFVRALFPRYYLWGAIWGALALPACVAVPLCFPEYRGARVGVQAIAIIAGILITLYAGNSLTPAINAARDRGPAGQELFEKLHRRAVRLNAVVLALGLALLVAFASRSLPRTSGIVEMTPTARAKYDAAISRVLQDAEAKYGFRPPRLAKPGEAAGPEPTIDQAEINEIDAIFAQKRLRDAARAKRSATAESAHPASGEDQIVPSQPGPRTQNRGEGR